MITSIRASLNIPETGPAPTAIMVTLLAAAIVTAALTGCGEGPGDGTYAGLFPDPDEVEQVTGAGQVTEYRDETLYQFLNGGAELYFDYDIVAVASREYTLADDAGIEISIYDMATPGDAFGIFSLFRYAGADRAEIGNEALVTPATLDFWKGRYYCKLFAFGGSDEAETAMANLAGSVARQIPETGSPPALLGLLPNTDRVEGSEKYFRRHLALNNIRYIDSENVFGLGGATEGVTADYRTAETGYTGYIIKYPTPAGAQAAVERYSTFVAAKAREASRNGIKTFILESGAIEAIALSGSYIVGIWDADAFDVGLMEGLLAAVAGED